VKRFTRFSGCSSSADSKRTGKKEEECLEKNVGTMLTGKKDKCENCHRVLELRDAAVESGLFTW
jgi:hypothetical protein